MSQLVQSQQGSTKLMVIVAMVMFVIIVCVVSGILIRVRKPSGLTNIENYSQIL